MILAPVRRYTFPLILMAALLAAAHSALAGFLTGYAYTRGLVQSEQGNPIWALYDPDNGEYIQDIGEATGAGSGRMASHVGPGIPRLRRPPLNRRRTVYGTRLSRRLYWSRPTSGLPPSAFIRRRWA